MAITINFPSNPTIGQQYTYAGRMWQWDGTVWLSLSIQGIQGTQGLGNQGVQGLMGIQGGEGYIGLDGAQGVQGTRGIQGYYGPFGDSAGIIYRYHSVNLLPGYIVFSTMSPSTITFSNIDYYGVAFDFSWLVKNYTGQVLAHLYIQSNNSTYNNFAIYSVFEITYDSETGWATASVELQTGTNFINGQIVSMYFVFVGEQGVQGQIGIQGTIGESIQGDIGIQGIVGEGIQGSQGGLGIQGDAGYIGEDGAQGSMGLQGEIGAQGNAGYIGEDGTQGSIGTQGLLGSQGSVGLQGSMGLQGFIGLQGEIGIQGIQGTIGSQGILGIQGNTGSQGILGIQGNIGTQGELGIQGSIGESIQGSIGIQGDIGIQGSQGELGAQGTLGESIQGDLGVQGLAGSVGFISIIDESTGSFSASATHKNNYTRVNYPTAVNVTIPKDTFSPGDFLTFEQTGNGTVTVVAGTDVTVNAYAGGVDTFGQYYGLQVICVASNVFTVIAGV